MKFGLLSYKVTRNIGDDIYVYAASRFLPQIDYFVERERLAEFESVNNEPVAVVMAGWFMWEKYSWPPVRCIIPKFISFHYTVGVLDCVKGASPAKEQFVSGLGADYLKAYGPVGCRDNHTLNLMKKKGVEAYLSGCVTLTLPNMPRLKAKKDYVCFSDLDADISTEARRKLEGTGLKVKTTTHKINYKDYDVPWEDRFKAVEELLTVYQNAKYVITSRLHCALPCLAMGVPVLLISRKQNGIRIKTWLSFINHVSPDDFLGGNYEYDFMAPTPNPTKYLELRERLTKEITEFVEQMKDNTQALEELVQTKYTEQELHKWQSEVMREVMHEWYADAKGKAKQIRDNAKDIKKLKKRIATISDENIERKKKKIAKQKKESNKLIQFIKRILRGLKRRLRKT